MKPLLLQHISARLTILEKKNLINYQKQQHSSLENKLIQNVPNYSYHEVSDEIDQVCRRIKRLMNKEGLASGWSSSEVESLFPDQKLPESIYVEGKSIDIELDSEFREEENDKITKQSRVYFEKLNEYHTNVLSTLKSELLELLRILENLRDQNNSRIKKEDDISTCGFELVGSKHWVRHVFNYFLNSGVLHSETSYEDFRKVFSGANVEVPISINEDYQGVVTLFMKELLADGQNIVLNNSQRWKRVSNMFLFGGKTLTPNRLKGIKISDVGDKVKLVNDAMSYIPAKE